MREQEDEAGNKIPHKGLLSRIVHGEHTSLNADQDWEDGHIKEKSIGEHR